MEHRDRRRVGRQDRGDYTRLTRPLERFPARDHLVEDRAKREDVGSGVHLVSFELFGRHVRQRPCDEAWGCLAAGECTAPRRRGGPGECTEPREAEVEQLRAARGEHDVARLQVAMNDTLCVRSGERPGDLDGRA